MSAGYVNLIIESGATFSTTMNIDDDTGANFNLTGYTAACKIRKSYYSDFNVYTLTVSIDSPATDGNITISATANQTATFKPGRYVYDVELTSVSSVTRILEGIVEVRPNATR
jgi:hypothetical protein